MGFHTVLAHAWHTLASHSKACHVSRHRAYDQRSVSLCHVVGRTGLPLARTFWVARLPGERTLAGEITLAFAQTTPAAPHPDTRRVAAPDSRPLSAEPDLPPPPQAQPAARRRARL